MNELTVIVEKVNDVLVTTSNRVAEELGVNHRDLLEKIDGYIKRFGAAELSADFYIPSNYVHPQNKQTYRNYLITEKGVAQLIGGYSAAVPKAFELNVAYINKFEEMKEIIKNPYKNLSQQQMMILALQEQEKIVERVEVLEDKIDNEIRVDNGEQRKIQKAVGTRVFQRIDIIPTLAEKKKFVFQALYRDVKDRFGVASYRDVKRKDLRDCLEYISTWIEPSELRIA
ncbi:Rha family transcriptional regulator [Fusobacterium necrophorum subsp. funduliforme]|uniref:ORF6C domain-containing protein n=1 Tax=Fusobacterium necrophorum TaxID=859 RepID=UPI00370E953A